MNLIRYPSKEFDRLLRKASALPPRGIQDTVRRILERVRTDGDRALLDFTRRFDHCRLRASQLRVPASRLKKAKVPAPLAAALRQSLRNIDAFSRASLEKDWSIRNRQGARVGERFDPIERVGVYIPGGTAPLVSSALMTLGLARVAGVPEIVVCTPPPVSEPLLFAFRLCGATEVYQVGGAQAIAAMAFGTRTIRPVAKILGPGNAYVTEAKRQVFGEVGIDLLAGPSEVMILADCTANPAWVAADLLAQAEHGKGSRIFLVSDSPSTLQSVANAVRRQCRVLPRRKLAEAILAETFYAVRVKKMSDAPCVANRIAPEHLQIIARNARGLAARCRTSGAVFVGPYSPTVLGDYLAGPSHTLPTGGAGKTFSGLRVQDFRRRTSVVEYDLSSLKRSRRDLEAIALAEGLLAHAHSAAIRLRK